MRTAVHLKQDITHWVASPSGYGGYTFSSPRHLKGRWEERADQYQTPGGLQKVSRTVVYISEDVAIEDYLFLGISNLADPALETNAIRVDQFEKTPDLRALDHLRKAYL